MENRINTELQHNYPLVTRPGFQKMILNITRGADISKTLPLPEFIIDSSYTFFFGSLNYLDLEICSHFI